MKANLFTHRVIKPLGSISAAMPHLSQEQLEATRTNLEQLLETIKADLPSDEPCTQG